MSKVTIFNRDGSVWREATCERVDPYCGEFRVAVFAEDPDLVRRLEGCPRNDHLIANLPMAVDDIDGSKWRKPEEEDPVFSVCLIADDGTEMRKWSGAKCVAFLKGTVSFNIDGVWHSATGNVVIEPEN